MGNYLKSDQLEYIATHIESIEKSKLGKGIYFCFDTIKNGSVAYDILLRVFPGHDTQYGIDKRDFHIFFDKTKRNEVYDKLSEEISGYALAHDKEISGNYGTDQSLADVETEVPAVKNDWTAYLIVGAAAVVILLLLWDRKKK